MKISINDIKFAPKTIVGSNICVYGEPNEKIKEWANYWKLDVNYLHPYSNYHILPHMPIDEMFNEPKHYAYVDGFSPNLNKHLHIGHLSNLVLAKAYQSLNIGSKFIAIFGDTLQGAVSKNDALEAYSRYCDIFNYRVDKTFFASEMKLQDFTDLIPGEGDYATTKVFDVSGEKVVGIKSDNSTTYFYQDVALAQTLHDTTLYLTGLEQENHFNLLHKLYPQTNHVGLGLIKFNGKKMSSSDGNIIFVSDVLNTLSEKFNGDMNLCYNILAAIILKSDPKSDKNINMNTIDNVNLSAGLYISYTMARMNSAGIELIPAKSYSDVSYKLKSLKAKVALKPHVLFEELIGICENINAMYPHYHIKDNPENKLMFQTKVSNMMLAAQELGLFPVTKV